MIFFIFIGICVLAWTALCLINDHGNDGVFLTSFFIAVILTIILVAMSCSIVAAGITKNIDTQAMIQKEASLRWQAETGAYKYDDIARKLLADNVTEWNEHLARNKERKKNIWISIFYPIDYDQFDYIPIELLEGHEE